MDEFADRFQFRQVAGLLLEQIFDGLHIMIGGALDFLYPLCMGKLEVIHQTVQKGVGVLGEGFDLRNAGVCGQALQPADLNLNSEAEQPVFAEDAAQACGLATVAAIDGRYGGQGGKLHRCSHQ